MGVAGRQSLSAHRAAKPLKNFGSLLKRGYFGFLGRVDRYFDDSPVAASRRARNENLNVLTPMLPKPLTTPPI
jgi:hypothetical protein